MLERDCSFFNGLEELQGISFPGYFERKPKRFNFSKWLKSIKNQTRRIKNDIKLK
ncbi:hypothetical protein X953_19880 (plasmid) [Virgibacillus sp. SK37]|nr:hypothetical protein X953_19880 [Virgibacillus sp. SK37]